jgi:hypothetical protein
VAALRSLVVDLRFLKEAESLCKEMSRCGPLMSRSAGRSSGSHSHSVSTDLVSSLKCSVGRRICVCSLAEHRGGMVSLVTCPKNMGVTVPLVHSTSVVKVPGENTKNVNGPVW